MPTPRRVFTTFLAALTIAAGTAATLAWQPPTEPAGTTTAPAAPATTKGYTRVTEKDDGTLTLEIAAKTFAPAAGKAGPKVHLVGAVHIADKPFYEALQKRLDASDLVLFECVKPPGSGAFDATLDEAGKLKATKARLSFLLSIIEEARSHTGKLPESLTQAIENADKRWKGLIAGSLTDAWGREISYTIVTPDAKNDESGEGGPIGIVTSLGPDGQSQDGKGDDIRVEGKPAPKKKAAKDAGLQAKMADALGLTFQLDQIDFGKPNWRSSDMSLDQLQARFESAGLEDNQLFKMLDGSSIMGKLASVGLWLVKLSPQTGAMLKLTMVDLLGSEDAMEMAPGAMKPMMEVIINDRNDVVLQDLRSVIDNEQKKDVAIFYGAGHFADMEAKLIKDFGYTLQGEEWIPAISVNPKDAGMTAAEAKKTRETMKKAIERQAETERKKGEKAKSKTAK